jgi:antirestriction protein ArdC
MLIMESLNDAQTKSKTMSLLEKLKQGISEVKSSEQFKAYLKAMSLFHSYSFANCLLIAMQKPDASNVAGYRTWQKLKRQVKKGEKGISIFAPMKMKQKNEEAKDEVDYITFFRVVHVFDVSQTEGEPLPQPSRLEIQNTHQELLASLLKFAETKGIKVVFENLEHVEGLSHKGQVSIHQDRNPTEQALILIHELAHEFIHWDPEKRPKLTKEQKELEAEAVAYVVSQQIGLPESNSDKYLALYHKSYDLQLSLEIIHRAAQEILHGITPSEKSEQATQAA